MDTATGSLTQYKLYIDGRWVDSASGQQFESHNPYTGKPWALIPRGNAEDRHEPHERAERQDAA